METKGEKNCLSGTKVVVKSQCEKACKELNVKINHPGELKEGKQCFSTSDRKCRTQTNLPGGGGFHKICKRSGDIEYC